METLAKNNLIETTCLANVSQADINCSEKRSDHIKKQKVNVSTVQDECKPSERASEKENDEWEVVDASSDDSEDSSSGDFDVIIPLKVIENSKSNATSTVTVVSGKETRADKNVNGTTAVGPNPQKSIVQSNHNKPVVNEKQNIETLPLKPKVKKRRIRLFTGDSSDEEVIKRGPENSKNINDEGDKNQNAQITLQSERFFPSGITSHEDNQNVLKNNATFTQISPTKFLSDTEITASDDISQKKKIYQPGSKSSKLCKVTEVESDEDIMEVPRIPHAKSSSHHMIPKKRQSHSREMSSHSHDSNCNSGSYLSLPNRQAKRKRLMQQMWLERERSLKLKMVKKMKTVFYHVLESIVSSSDESEDCSLSDEEDMHGSKMRRKRKQQCNKQCCTDSHHNDNNKTENIQDLKRELEFWKNKAKNGTEKLSPREIQIREMKEDLNYWKRLATSKSAPSSSHSYNTPRTSTPMKGDNLVPEIPLTHEIPNVTFSADTTTKIPQHISQPKPVDCTNEDVWFSTRDKERTNNIHRATYKASVSNEASKALNIMSRTKFTEKEKYLIVDYLINNYDQLELLKGNMFWMQMAHDLDTHRSWHSLKNNFFTNIIKNLELYEMPSKVRNKIIGLANQYM